MAFRSLRNWFSAPQTSGARDGARRSKRFNAGLEAMEDRLVLSSMVMVDDPNITEGTGVARAMAFKVGLTFGSDQPITVSYTTVANTARADADFLPTSGTLTFYPGETATTVLVPLVTDAVAESRESFYLQITGVTNASILKARGIGTILDDDAVVAPRLSISNPRLAEGNSGTRQMIFALTLNTPVHDRVVSVRLTTMNGSAQAGSDYEARSEVITFAPGTTTAQFAVTIFGDTEVEGTDTIYVSLTESNVALATTTAMGMILNDD